MDTKPEKMEIEVNNILVDKAVSKKDGVYLYKGYYYAVIGGRFEFYADYFGNIYSVHGIFHSKIGSCKRSEIKNELNKLIKPEK